jgi:hypothetical protein
MEKRNYELITKLSFIYDKKKINWSIERREGIIGKITLNVSLVINIKRLII